MFTFMDKKSCRKNQDFLSCFFTSASILKELYCPQKIFLLFCYTSFSSCECIYDEY